MKILSKLRSLVVPAPAVVIPRGRHRTLDIAFPYRMGAGFAGDVNRTHPCTIEPTPIDLVIPPTAFGLGVVVDAVTKRVRLVQPGDTVLYGIAVRPYPFQQQSGTNYGMIGIGAAAPSTSQPLDVLRSGYIIVPVVGAPGKGDATYVWSAVSAGAHVQGGFESVNPAGSGFLVTETTFNGTPDAGGLSEIAFNI